MVLSVAYGGRLYVTTPDGEELEIIVPEGVESDEEFDVDMADVSDEEAAAPAPAPAPVPAPALPTHGPLRLQRSADSTSADYLSPVQATESRPRAEGRRPSRQRLATTPLPSC